MQDDIVELRRRVLALIATVNSGDLRWRLVEMYELLGDLPRDAGALLPTEGHALH